MTAAGRRDPAALEAERFDLAVIGGGISGACLAWDACLRGLRVALVEQNDFGWATSSATSKLIHGGLRYLKNGEIGLVRESLRERRILQAIAPHLVWPLPFMIPTYPKGNTKWLIRAGMLAYDTLSFDRNRGMDPDHRMPGHRWLAPAAVLEAEPAVEREGLTGAAVYYDGQCNPDRLTLEFLLGARALGAVCINYARVDAAARRAAGELSLAVHDRLDGRERELSARMVVNTAGPWADRVDHLFGTGEDVSLVRSKGIHLVTRALCRDHALVLRTPSGAHLFVIPWRGHSLIGTTDTRYEGPVSELGVTAADIEQFLAEINGAVPDAGLVPDDVLFCYAGVRPLVEQDTQVYQASRRYEIVDHHRRGHRGLLSAVGGKYTTSRNLAEKLTDRLLLYLDRPAVRCLTADRLLPGGMTGRFEDFVQAQLREQAGRLAPEQLEHLVRTYGARYNQVLALVGDRPELGEPVAAGRPEILAELAFAVEREQALTLCDALLRRTGIGTLGHPGQAAVDRMAGLMAAQLGWDADRTGREKAMFAARVCGAPEHHFERQQPASAPVDGAADGGSNGA